MVMDTNSPYILIEPDEVKRRLAMLTSPHIAPLITYAQQIMARLGSNYQIPYLTRAMAEFILKCFFFSKLQDAKL